jgi:hypothetical protein|tara:strand:- start:56928 stop:57512 length:585 start_codon:yes stop_codon:yes gene_type:complete
MENTLNSGSLESLNFGETLLVSARKVKNEKIHLEFAEIIKQSNDVNVLGMLNKSDDSFSSNARRAWVTAEPVDATEYFGVDFGPTASWYITDRGEMLDLNILNPSMNDIRCRLRITETIEGTEWQNENVDTAAKRKGKDGDHMTHLGAYIFSNTSVMLNNDTDTSDMHTYLEADADVTTTQPKEYATEELASLI